MIQHIRWQVVVILVGALLVGSFLAYLAFTRTTVLVPERGGTYVEGLAGCPRCINPILCQYNDVDQDLVALVFNGLTKVGKENEIIHDLAESWEISEDGLVYTFHLRHDIRWHDGLPFTAEDVVFTAEAMQDPHYQGVSYLGALWRSVRAKKIDDYTVEFILKEPFAPFLEYTTIGILPAHLLAGVSAEDLPEHEFNRKPMGTGPFRVKELTEEHIVLEANPYFYGPKPYLSKIEFKLYPSYEEVYSAYERGEIEGIGRVQPEDVPRLASESQLNLLSAPLSGYAIVFLNLDNPRVPFFQEKEIRQALLYGLDRQGIIDRDLKGYGLVAHSPIMPQSWAYYEGVTKYDYDPERASALLEEAGWRLRGDAREKDGIRLEFTLLSDGDPRRAKLAEDLARQWEEIGVKAVPQVSSVGDALRSHRFEAALVNLTILPDPDLYPFWHQTQIERGQNYACFDNREASELLEEARRTTEQGRRVELYRSFQEIFAEEVPSLLLYYPVYIYAIDEKVKGVQVEAAINPSDRFRGIVRWYIATKRVLVSQAK